MAKSIPPPPWVELPLEITGLILQKLGSLQILKTAQMVCKTWRSVSLDPTMWRVIDFSFRDQHLLVSRYNFKKTCRLAVDRSQGQLVEINVQFNSRFSVSDDLLDYIAQRSGYLRRLRLVYGSDLSSEALIKAFKKFPFLEELQLYYVRITKEAIEAIGHSCLQLESFSLHYVETKYPRKENDEEAFAIAKSMPALRHLELVENRMTNEGLKAILDGCPHLISLDIRGCFHVSLAGSLERRCQQIKHFKRPFKSIWYS